MGDETEKIKSIRKLKSRTDKKTYTVRAVCRKCGKRSFQNVKLSERPKTGDRLQADCVDCKEPLYCSSVFKVNQSS